MSDGRVTTDRSAYHVRALASLTRHQNKTLCTFSTKVTGEGLAVTRVT